MAREALIAYYCEVCKRAGKRVPGKPYELVIREENGDVLAASDVELCDKDAAPLLAVIELASEIGTPIDRLKVDRSANTTVVLPAHFTRPAPAAPAIEPKPPVVPQAIAAPFAPPKAVPAPQAPPAPADPVTLAAKLRSDAAAKAAKNNRPSTPVQPAPRTSAPSAPGTSFRAAPLGVVQDGEERPLPAVLGGVVRATEPTSLTELTGSVDEKRVRQFAKAPACEGNAEPQWPVAETEGYDSAGKPKLKMGTVRVSCLEDHHGQGPVTLFWTSRTGHVDSHHPGAKHADLEWRFENLPEGWKLTKCNSKTPEGYICELEFVSDHAAEMHRRQTRHGKDANAA